MVKLIPKNWIIIGCAALALIIFLIVIRVFGSDHDRTKIGDRPPSQNGWETGDASENCLAQGNTDAVCGCRIEAIRASEYAELFLRYEIESQSKGAEAAYLVLTEIEQIQLLDLLDTAQTACPPNQE